MPKQIGLIRIEGTLGDVTFFRSQDGFMAKQKTVISGQRIKTDRAFQRTRENMSEFGRAGKASKIFRKAFNELIIDAKDRRVTGRLVQLLVKVIQADAVNDRGKRQILDAETEMMKGFEFNINGTIRNTLYVTYETSIDRVTGQCQVQIPSFVAANSIIHPADATHYRFVTGSSAIDFEQEKFTSDFFRSAIEPISNIASAPLTLSTNLPANSTHPLFLMLGIQFFQQINGKYYSYRNGALNALTVAHVNGV